MKVKVHPEALKQIRQGHPWILKDEFTAKFPRTEPVIEVEDGERELTFIHDPDHPLIKARLWSTTGALTIEDAFLTRLKIAFSKRKALLSSGVRDNVILCFGEPDQLPGLLITKLGPGLLIQANCALWIEMKDWLVRTIQKVAGHLSGALVTAIWFQDRRPGSKRTFECLWGQSSPKWTIKEFGVDMEISMDGGHDFGIYTDMSSIRSQVIDSIKGAPSVLNLFCYTGVFSLQALRLKRPTTSVDASATYLAQLQRNLDLNSFDQSLHRLEHDDAFEFLKRESQSNKRYGQIILDPPSSFTVKGKKKSCFSLYPSLLKNTLALMDPRGTLHAFLNTHSIRRQKFMMMVREQIKGKYRIEKEYWMSDDCPKLKGFPQGDYLKGVAIKKI